MTTETFTRVNNDVNGNPRYVCHFLNLLTDKEQNDIRENSNPFESVNDMYNFALQRAKAIGGRKFHNKQYGGGIVFQSYNLQQTIKDIENAKN